jgi:serine/threonine-protein kinase
MRALLDSSSDAPLRIGRYFLFEEIGSGGMARVYLGRMASEVGISKVVAIKRMHTQFAGDVEFREMFLSEASLAARVTHPNVVSILDVVSSGRDILMVMEYVRGAALSMLVRAAKVSQQKIPIPVAVAVLIDVLRGLHAAHEANDEMGQPLGIIHRDVSPHNVLVGTDGLSRIFDFGIAKALGQAHATRDGVVKGKLAYMSPERLDQPGDQIIDRRADIFSAAVVLWEMLAGERLYSGVDSAETLGRVLLCNPAPLRERRAEVSAELASVVHRALAREPDRRFATADDMASALEAAAPTIASRRAVADWVRSLAAPELAERQARLAEMERVDLFAEGPDSEASHDTASSLGNAAAVTTDGTRTSMVVRPGSRRRTLAAVALTFGAVLGAWLILHMASGGSLQIHFSDTLNGAPGRAPPPAPAATSNQPSTVALPPPTSAVAEASIAPSVSAAPASAAPVSARPVPSVAPAARATPVRGTATARPVAPPPADTGYMPERP